MWQRVANRQYEILLSLHLIRPLWKQDEQPIQYNIVLLGGEPYTVLTISDSSRSSAQSEKMQ